MKKDNSLLIVIIVFLSVALGICGGILFTKFNDNNGNKVGSEINNNDKEEQFSLEDAKTLMKKYKMYNGICGYDYYLRSLDSLAEILRLSMMNIDASGTINYNQVSNTKAYKEIVGNDYFKGQNFEYYNFDDVLNSAKELFGENYSISRNLKYSDGIQCEWQYPYVEELDKFVNIELGCGGGCSVSSSELSVDTFVINNGVLKIKTSEIVIFEESDTRVNKYEYTFQKNTRGSYYLTNISELDN